MKYKRIDITPAVTVHNLLQAYPELEDVLIGMAPPFKKLKNPVLRKTVAKVATLKHVASVGGIPLDELIYILRQAVGQTSAPEHYDDEEYFGERPEWFSPDKIVCTIEEGNRSDMNKMALTDMLKEARNVKAGEIIELITTFLPAPGIDIMKSKGYSVWTQRESDKIIKSYFLKHDM